MKEAKVVDNFIDMHVEGIIACLAQNTTDYSHFEEIADMGIPLVFFGRTCMSDKFSTVTANGDEAAQMATEHLIETGSRHIAFIGGPNHLDMVKRRKHGYLEALREHRIPIDREVVVCDKIDYHTAFDNTMKLLSKENRPDAILAFNDIVTFAAYSAIRQMKMHIPDDVALIGFSDDLHTEYVTPRMSVIADQSQTMGHEAWRLLMKAINGDTKVRKVIVPQKLVSIRFTVFSVMEDDTAIAWIIRLNVQRCSLTDQNAPQHAFLIVGRDCHTDRGNLPFRQGF